MGVFIFPVSCLNAWINTSVMWVCSICQWVSVSFMSCFICHFQLFHCAVISLTLSPSPEMPSDRWMRGCWTRLSLFLSAASYSSCCCSGSRSRCVYLLCPPPPLPVPLSLQYGSPVWEAAIPLFLHPFHLAVLLWVLAPLCPTHPVEGTGSKSLWYLAPRCPEQVTRRAFCLFSPWTELTTVCCRPPPSCFCLCCRSACLCCTQTKLSNPISSVCQRLSPATVVFGPCKPCLCFIATLPWIQLLDAFYRCTNLELLGVH